MAKRITYEIGNIFTVPLENGLKGVGRILIKDQATVFIELYRIRPIADISEFNFDAVIKEKPIAMQWTYDTAIRKGVWEIIGNKTITEEISMPYFWTQDAGDKKYYIRKGTNYSYETFGERIEIPKEDIHKYEPYGIGNDVSVRHAYISRLREIGFI